MTARSRRNAPVGVLGYFAPGPAPPAPQPMRLSLLARTVVALVVVGLVPLAVVPYLIRLNAEALADQVLRAHALAARTTAAQVSALLASVQGAVTAAALNPELTAEPGSPASQGVLSGLLQAQPRFAAASLRNAEGQELFRVHSRTLAAMVERLLAEPLAGSLALRREEGRPWLRVAAPTPSGTGSLEVVADITELDLVLRPDELGRDAVLALATRDGRLLSATGPEVSLESFPAALVAAGRSGQVSGAVSSAQAGGVIGAYAPVAGAAWFVVSRQPSSVAEAVGGSMRRRALLAVAVALALTAAVSAGAWRSVVRPLRDLVAAQRRLARAEFPSRRGDEIGSLRDAVSLLERQTSDREAIGERFLGRYQVLDVLGSGGMGSVFRGWDPKLQRQVALKTVRHAASGARARAAQARGLVDEAVLVAGLSHPNLVAIYDVEDSAEAAFISMELVEGTNLERYLSRVRKLRLDEAPPLVALVARGLGAAHARGIVHRDVKPGNVLLGRDGAVKLTDFGVAGEVAASSAPVLGTPGFIPPEALRGEPQDARGDLFACGVLLYFSLGGCLPFSGRSAPDTLLATLREEPVPIRQRLVSVPQVLDDLVRGLLEKDPRRRWPQSADEIAERLEAMCAERGWRWTGPTVVEGAGGRTGDTGAVGTVPEVGPVGGDRRGGPGISRGRA